MRGANGFVKTASLGLWLCLCLAGTSPAAEKRSEAAPKGGWQKWIRDGDLVHHVIPKYPVEAREWGIQGTVVVRLDLRPDGTVAKATAERKTRSLLLNGAAVDALRQWRFRPGKFETVRVPVKYVIDWPRGPHVGRLPL